MANKALIIGIEQHLESAIPPVKYAQADAEAFAAAIQAHGFREADQHLILNSSATKTQVDYHITQCLRGVTEEDTLLVYFAGHGLAVGGRNYLLCHDSIPAMVEQSCVALHSLLAAAEASPCQRIALFLDCCHGGSEIDGVVGPNVAAMDVDELQAFVSDSPHRVVFSACGHNETSHAHDGLGHGLWAHHLIKALTGQASDACDGGTRITATSLQDYLAGAVALTWKQAFTTPCSQTPTLWGNASEPFIIGDIAPALAQRAAATGVMALDRVSLRHVTSGPIKTLSGFQKGFHKVPDRAGSWGDSLVHKLALGELQDDIEQTRQALRGSMNYTRRQLTVEDATDGCARIITPDFEYMLTVSQDPDAPGDYIMEQWVGNFDNNEIVMHAGFLATFGSCFDALVFETAAPIDITQIIDRIEEAQPTGVALQEYDPECTYCTIGIDGLDADILVNSHAIQVRYRGKASPAAMVESFAAICEQLAASISPDALSLPPGAG